MLLRILASVVLLFSILFLPFYISVILALGAIFYFSLFFEAVFLFFIIDLLYGVKGGNYHTTFISFFIALVLVIVLEFLKNKFRLNK